MAQFGYSDHFSEDIKLSASGKFTLILIDVGSLPQDQLESTTKCSF